MRQAIFRRALRPTSRILLIALMTLPLVFVPRTGSAQLGRLKKMGADAVKEAVKDKLGAEKKKETPTASGTTSPTGETRTAVSESGAPKIDDARIALVLGSMMPQIKGAQSRAAAAAAIAAYEQKQSAAEACAKRAEKSPPPANIAAAMEKNAARFEEMTRKTEAMRERYDKAMEANNVRQQVFLEDSMHVMSMRTSTAFVGVPCAFEFAPAALLESRVLERQGLAGERFDPGEGVRGTLSRTDYAILRERLALWTLLQADPALKDLGRYGVFTAEEQAVLSRHAAELVKLAPLFKTDALVWKGPKDLRDW